MSNIFRLNLKDIAGAILSAIIVAVLGYLSNLTNIYTVDFSELLNVVILTAIASLMKSLGTNKEGKFLGGVQVK